MSILFLIDENLSPLLVGKFEQLGYKAVAVRDIGLRGADDTKIIQWAKEHNAVIITGDMDFGELWYWYYAGLIGIIVLRLHSQSLLGQEKIIDYLERMSVLKDSNLDKALIIASEHHHRIRVNKGK